MGNTRSKQKKEGQGRAEKRMRIEGGPGGCKQARSRRNDSRKDEKRGICTANDDLSVCDAGV